MILINNDGGDDQDFVGGHLEMIILIMVMMTMILTKSNMRRREELDFGDDAGDHEEENGEGRGDGECGKEEIGDTVSTKSWWARKGLGKLWRKLKTDVEMRLGQTRDAGCGDGGGGDKKSVDS